MVQNNDDLGETRRKALRNGEEDPVVAAQRYLNIYRQMHIFSAERKEAFDKMLLEMPENARSTLSNLPGGLILQDYISELMEKNNITEEKKTSYAPILETAKTQAKIQNQIAEQSNIQYIQAANSTVSLSEDFVKQFSEAINNILQKQSELNKESVEKIGQGLSKNQLAIAQYINQNKEIQLKAIEDLTKTLTENESQIQALKELTQVLLQSQQRNISADANENQLGNSTILKQLIETQQAINLKISKMESTFLSDNTVNHDLVNLLIKSNSEVVQTFSNIQTNLADRLSADNTEHLLQLIENSQSKLIDGVVRGILQNNVSTNQTQANNIQINTSDTTAQTMLLLEKIINMQNNNEKNLEAAINRLIETQQKSSSEQGKNIAEAIVKNLQDVSHEKILEKTNVPSETDDCEKIKNDFEKNNEIIEDTNYAIDENKIEQIISSEDGYVKPKKKKKKKKKNITIQSLENENTTNQESNEILNEINNLQTEENINEEEVTELLFEGDKTFIDENAVIMEAKDFAEPIEDITAKAPIEEPKPEVEVRKKYPKSTILSKEKLQEINSNLANAFIQEEYNASKEDWGFEIANQADINKQDNLQVVEEDFANEEFETIGEGSNIYIEGNFKTFNNDNSPIIYNTNYPILKVEPQIYDDADDVDDPYAK